MQSSTSVSGPTSLRSGRFRAEESGESGDYSITDGLRRSNRRRNDPPPLRQRSRSCQLSPGDSISVQTPSGGQNPTQWTAEKLHKQVEYHINHEWAVTQLEVLYECLDNPERAKKLGITITVIIPGTKQEVCVAPLAEGVQAKGVEQYKAAAKCALGKLEEKYKPNKENFFTYTWLNYKRAYEQLQDKPADKSWEEFLNTIKQSNKRYFQYTSDDGAVVTMSSEVQQPFSRRSKKALEVPLSGSPVLTKRRKEDAQKPES